MPGINSHGIKCHGIKCRATVIIVESATSYERHHLSNKGRTKEPHIILYELVRIRKCNVS